MKVLSIDTSCDDTAVAVVEKKEGKMNILSNVVSSQTKIHQEYGGVFPWLAKREHQKNLVPVLKQALKESVLLSKRRSDIDEKEIKKILKREPELALSLIDFLKDYKKPKINAIAVTKGPGLEPCLWVGINFALALALAWKLKVIPVNHIEGHILSVNKKIKLPCLALVVSGGHTQLVFFKKIGKYRVVGETKDDAAGECFDKTARILGLAYPGGPSISKEAEYASKKRSCLPRPMLNTKDYDFSFSGLKTAVLYESKGKKKTKEYKRAMAREIQEAVIEVLLKKTKKAAQDLGAKTIILSGGVSANKELRKRFQEECKEKLLLPELDLSTDNGAMIGIASLFSLSYKKRVRADGNLRIC